jgi:hypothetical protein
MNVGDIVELIDEDSYGNLYRGRMTVVSLGDNPNADGEYVIECAHPNYEQTCLFLEEELVVMEEADD